MRRAAFVAVLGLAVAACTPGGSNTTTTASTASTTTSTVATTTTAAPSLGADGLCDELKIASFDLQAQLDRVMEPLLAEGTTDLAEVDEEALSAELSAAVIGFYQRVEELAADAPAEVASDLAVVGTAAGPLEEALADADPDAELELADVVGQEVVDAADRATAWTEDACGVPIALAPDEVVESTLMLVALQAFSQMFTELGEGFAEGLEESFSGSFEGDDGGSTVAGSDGMGYGSSAELDALWDDCAAGGGEACDELFSVTPIGSEYEAFAQTCGGTVPLRSGFALDCGSKLSEGGPQIPGDDPALDELAESCEGGDTGACDELFLVAPLASGYEEIALTCGGARPEGGAAPCEFTESGQPFTYGDDGEYDRLWDDCVGGDAAACSDLYISTPFDSAYEAMGQVCENLLAEGASCDRLAGFLLGPGR